VQAFAKKASGSKLAASIGVPAATFRMAAVSTSALGATCSTHLQTQNLDQLRASLANREDQFGSISYGFGIALYQSYLYMTRLLDKQL